MGPLVEVHGDVLCPEALAEEVPQSRLLHGLAASQYCAEVRHSLDSALGVVAGVCTE